MIKNKAYAKINIGLRILNKREDGYHNLETVFHRVNIYDTLTFSLPETDKDAIELSSNRAEIPTDDSNLCIKAAKLLMAETGIKNGVRIALEKNIPVGAGLGGGSSDAASTLLALNKFWGLNKSRNVLCSLASKLGSDVPFFLGKDSAFATGRGELLEYLQFKLPYWILVVNPGIHVSTAWAYSQIKPNNQFADMLKQLVQRGAAGNEYVFEYIVNDFEREIFSFYPQIETIKNEMILNQAVFAQMSGSGSSVYGFFSNQMQVMLARECFEKQYRTFITPPGFIPDLLF